MRKSILINIALAAAITLPLAAQQPPALKLPRVSQHAVLTQTIGLTDMTITYSRPGVKGRKVFGALVPYGKVWRTGANEATKISFSDDVTINGKPLPKGTYSLHTIPGEHEWTIIFNKVADQWGSFSYKESEDALRVTATPRSESRTEWMEFDVPQLSTDNATVEIRWDTVAVPFTVGTGTTAKVMADAKKAVAEAKADDERTPRMAAQFALDSGDLADAMTWIDQSVKAKETANNLYLRARIEAAKGDKAAAVRSAEAALAKVGNNAEFAEEIKGDIASWKK
jgi:hypothetical protein